MTVEEAIRRTIQAFPFNGYMLAEKDKGKGTCSNIGKTALRYLKPGSTIFDFLAVGRVIEQPFYSF